MGGGGGGGGGEGAPLWGGAAQLSRGSFEAALRLAGGAVGALGRGIRGALGGEAGAQGGAAAAGAAQAGSVLRAGDALDSGDESKPLTLA